MYAAVVVFVSVASSTGESVDGEVIVVRPAMGGVMNEVEHGARFGGLYRCICGDVAMRRVWMVIRVGGGRNAQHQPHAFGHAMSRKRVEVGWLTYHAHVHDAPSCWTTMWQKVW